VRTTVALNLLAGLRIAILGAIAQAQGYALMENFQMKDGYVLTDQLSTYLIPTVLDVPDLAESVIVEVPEPRGPARCSRDGERPRVGRQGMDVLACHCVATAAVAIIS
jgi:xanthine dehydrogenase molybdopterin-binding subunit B